MRPIKPRCVARFVKLFLKTKREVHTEQKLGRVLVNSVTDTSSYLMIVVLAQLRRIGRFSLQVQPQQLKRLKVRNVDSARSTDF